jgi:pilus assembly protein CpaD
VDYRIRHPIKLREGTRAVELFIGSFRTDLTPVQRAEVASFAHGWHRNATGGVAIRLPTGTPTRRRRAKRCRKSARSSSPPASPLVASW